MRLLCAAGVLIAAAASMAEAQTSAGSPASPEQAMLRDYCVSCHNDKLKRGNLVLSGLDAAHPETDAAVWEKVIRKVRSGMMPPAGARRPEAAKVNAFASAIEMAIDRAASSAPNPGKLSLHRLNRTEYANSVRDLLGFEIEDVNKPQPDPEG